MLDMAKKQKPTDQGKSKSPLAKRYPPFSPKEIRELRESLNLSVEEAAAKMEVSARTWYSWEDGTRQPSRSALKWLHYLRDPKNFTL